MPNTLDVGAPNGAKSDITLRDGDGPGEVAVGEVDLGGVVGRAGSVGVYVHPA